MIAPFLWLAVAAASPAGADADLAVLRAEIRAAIDRWDPGLERSEEDLGRWKGRVDRLIALWTAFRDARCDPRLLRYEQGEGSAACRQRLSRVIVADLRSRFDLAPGRRGRASIEETAAPGAAARSPEEGGPCADPPPAECDYCGVNRCWERRLRAANRDLHAVWRATLAKIGKAPGLTPARRADWAGRLLASQRLWLKWRDEECDLEAWETPNPYAHSIYALVTGPCLDSETRARTAVLRRCYRFIAARGGSGSP